MYIVNGLVYIDTLGVIYCKYNKKIYKIGNIPNIGDRQEGLN